MTICQFDHHLTDAVPMPTHLTIGTTNRCNLRCRMCARQHFVQRAEDQVDMDFGLFERIADECFPFVETVAFTVSGEPLLARDLRKMIDRVQRANVRLEMVSNGTLLKDEDLVRALTRSLSWITISFDGATKETFESIRVGARFDEVVGNIERFNRIRRELPEGQRPVLGLNFVLMRSNVEEFPDFVRLAHELGADSVACAHVSVLPPHLANAEESLALDNTRVNQRLEEGRQLAAALGVYFDGPAAPSPPEIGALAAHRSAAAETHVTRPGLVKCPFVWNRAWIEFDGQVVPCCNGDPDRPVMGSLTEGAFRDIWNGEAYRGLRTGLLSGRPPDVCTRCTFARRE